MEVSGIKHVSLSISALESLEDPNTDPRLLPVNWRGGDNSRRLRHCKKALKKATEICVTPVQRRQIELYYNQGLSKSDIAKMQGVGCSAVTKSIRTGEKAIRAYVQLYMDIYDGLEKEWLDEQ